MRLPRLGVLGGYLVRQNLFLMLTCLGAGTFIYLLTDLADRLEHFLSAGLGVRQILTYFVVKTPLIFAQILPAVFLLSVVIQIGLLVRNREMMALRANGVSLGRFVRFFVIYAILWSFGQLFFSQFVAAYGEREASRIWKEEVSRHQADEGVVRNLWFREGPYIVHADEAQPLQNRVRNITVYELDPATNRLARITIARKGLIDEHGWGLLDAWEIGVENFSAAKMLTSFIPLEQDLHGFLLADTVDRADLPLWSLSHVIDELRESGSNVERLRTAWHGKWSYAFSIVTMALIALAMCTLFENMYLNLILSMLVVFGFYSIYVLGIALGQKGLLPPIVGAWMADVAFMAFAGLRLVWVCFPRFAARVRGWAGKGIRRGAAA